MFVHVHVPPLGLLRVLVFLLACMLVHVRVHVLACVRVYVGARSMPAQWAKRARIEW